MNEFSHALGSDPTTGAIPQKTLDWLSENLPDGGTSGSVTADDVDSGEQPFGRVLTTDGSGGAGWAAPSGGEAGGGTSDHSALLNRTLPDQHPIGAVTGLQAALDGKSATDHTHTPASIGAAAASHTHDDRYYTEAEADGRFVRTVNNTGPDANGNVTVAAGGGGATDHGALTGLSDDDHPQYALADGTRGSFAATNHSHAISGVTGLQAALDGKAASSHSHSAADVGAVPTSRTVNGKALSANISLGAADVGAAPASHGHAVGDVTGLQGALDGKAASSHTHDDRYYTETEMNTVLAGKADTTHTHAEYAPATQTINAQTGTAYTLAASDAGKVVTATNASPVTITVRASSFTAGQRVDVLQRGAGPVTFAAGSGTTLHGTPSLVTRDQWSAASVLFLSATEAVVIGDLATP